MGSIQVIDAAVGKTLPTARYHGLSKGHARKIFAVTDDFTRSNIGPFDSNLSKSIRNETNQWLLLALEALAARWRQYIAAQMHPPSPGHRSFLCVQLARGRKSSGSDPDHARVQGAPFRNQPVRRMGGKAPTYGNRGASLTYERISSKQKGANGKSSRLDGLVAKRACLVQNPHKREDLS